MIPLPRLGGGGKNMILKVSVFENREFRNNIIFDKNNFWGEKNKFYFAKQELSFLKKNKFCFFFWKQITVFSENLFSKFQNFFAHTKFVIFFFQNTFFVKKTKENVFYQKKKVLVYWDKKIFFSSPKNYFCQKLSVR